MAAKPGLYANINAKRARIAAGSGEKMRKPGSKGAPSKMDFVKSARTAKPVKRSEGSGPKGEAVYEILGRRVTKEQYDEASKEMDRPKSKVEEDMDDFAKQAKERAMMKPKKMMSGGMADKVGRAMKKPTADAKGRAMSKKAPKKMMGGGMMKGYAGGGDVTCGKATRGYGAARKGK
jgi:hypothetical protein